MLGQCGRGIGVALRYLVATVGDGGDSGPQVVRRMEDEEVDVACLGDGVEDAEVADGHGGNPVHTDAVGEVEFDFPGGDPGECRVEALGQ